MSFFLIGFFAFLPILLWGYLFTYIDSSKFNRLRFLSGIIAGGLSVFPILYMGDIFEAIKFEFINIFNAVSKVDSIGSAFSFLFSLDVFLFFLGAITLIFGIFLFFQNALGSLKMYFKNIVFILIFSVLMSVIIYFFGFVFDIFPMLNKSIEPGVSFGSVAFDTLKLVLFYYLIVGITEEASKHFNFLGSSYLQVENINKGVLYAIFIALGFGFIENILYFINIYKAQGISSPLIGTYFFRSLFSVFVHVTCSAIVAFHFSKGLIDYKNDNKIMPFLKAFLYGFLLSVFTHAVFDISLTLNFSIIIFIYFIFGYFYITGIFYKPEE